MARLSLKPPMTWAKSRKQLFVGIALALCLAMPAFALATAGSSVQASSFTASRKEAVAGQKVTFSVTIQQPQNATSAYAHLRSADGTQLQVKLNDNGNGPFTGTFPCSSETALATWRCKAIQTCDIVGNWGYVRDGRFYEQGGTDLSALDAVVCLHEWDDWIITKSPTAKRRAPKNACAACAADSTCALCRRATICGSK